MRPQDAIVQVSRIDGRLARYDWAFVRDEKARIAAHWAERCRLQPRLYDGRVLLAHDVEIVDDYLRSTYFETSFRSFLSWRDFDFPGAPIANCFAMSALRSADGAFMLGEMSASTANAGRLYFPAGTPEPADAGADGRVDLEANVLRELEEETGLRRADVALDDGWTVVFDGPRVACMKLVQSSESAAALQARLEAFNAGQADPELARLVPVADAADLDVQRMPVFMIRYLRAALDV